MRVQHLLLGAVHHLDIVLLGCCAGSRHRATSAKAPPSRLIRSGRKRVERQAVWKRISRQLSATYSEIDPWAPLPCFDLCFALLDYSSPSAQRLNAMSLLTQPAPAPALDRNSQNSREKEGPVGYQPVQEPYRSECRSGGLACQNASLMGIRCDSPQRPHRQ